MPTHAVSASLLAPRYIDPFTVAERHGSAYTLERPSDMRLHRTFYVGRLKPYVQPKSSSRDGSPTTTRGATSAFRKASSPSAQRSKQQAPSHEPPRERGATEDCGQPEIDHMMSVHHRRQKHNSVRDTIHRELDRIVDYTCPKTNRGPVRFRIRWWQSGLLRDTWFPRNVLMTDVPEMVRAYEAYHGLEAYHCGAQCFAECCAQAQH
ncbi:hypothetical protein PHMEG_00015642 [Phytophthora megakarya]|uniref:Tf2-1-like SH3-like domain-containing protein n=1 Tax=Phytophthora megakarya TaxID=4795 RepID=A0A225W2W2_9STRA|nr:hypothetical protein PHMEG_00015642 [Phytophthora megakarya]